MFLNASSGMPPPQQQLLSSTGCCYSTTKFKFKRLKNPPLLLLPLPQQPFRLASLLIFYVLLHLSAPSTPNNNSNNSNSNNSKYYNNISASSASALLRNNATTSWTWPSSSSSSSTSALPSSLKGEWKGPRHWGVQKGEVCPSARQWVTQPGSFCSTLWNSPFLSNRTELERRERRAIQSYCEVESILDRFDCRQEYSIEFDEVFPTVQCRLCQQAYREWACAMVADTLVDGQLDCQSKLMPCPSCASICHQVMRLCPYLSPDRIQSGHPLPQVSQYGGHPAFYCPLENDDPSDPAYTSLCFKTSTFSEDPDYVHNICTNPPFHNHKPGHGEEQYLHRKHFHRKRKSVKRRSRTDDGFRQSYGDTDNNEHNHDHAYDNEREVEGFVRLSGESRREEDEEDWNNSYPPHYTTCCWTYASSVVTFVPTQSFPNYGSDLYFTEKISSSTSSPTSNSASTKSNANLKDSHNEDGGKGTTDNLVILNCCDSKGGCIENSDEDGRRGGGGEEEVWSDADVDGHGHMHSRSVVASFSSNATTITRRKPDNLPVKPENEVGKKLKARKRSSEDFVSSSSTTTTSSTQNVNNFYSEDVLDPDSSSSSSDDPEEEDEEGVDDNESGNIDIDSSDFQKYPLRVKKRSQRHHDDSESGSGLNVPDSPSSSSSSSSLFFKTIHKSKDSKILLLPNPTTHISSLSPDLEVDYDEHYMDTEPDGGSSTSVEALEEDENESDIHEIHVQRKNGPGESRRRGSTLFGAKGTPSTAAKAKNSSLTNNATQSTKVLSLPPTGESGSHSNKPVAVLKNVGESAVGESSKGVSNKEHQEASDQPTIASSSSVHYYKKNAFMEIVIGSRSSKSSEEEEDEKVEEEDRGKEGSGVDRHFRRPDNNIKSKDDNLNLSRTRRTKPSRTNTNYKNEEHVTKTLSGSGNTDGAKVEKQAGSASDITEGDDDDVTTTTNTRAKSKNSPTHLGSSYDNFSDNSSSQTPGSANIKSRGGSDGSANVAALTDKDESSRSGDTTSAAAKKKTFTQVFSRDSHSDGDPSYKDDYEELDLDDIDTTIISGKKGEKGGGDYFLTGESVDSESGESESGGKEQQDVERRKMMNEGNEEDINFYYYYARRQSPNPHRSGSSAYYTDVESSAARRGGQASLPSYSSGAPSSLQTTFLSSIPSVVGAAGVTLTLVLVKFLKLFLSNLLSPLTYLISMFTLNLNLTFASNTVTLLRERLSLFIPNVYDAIDSFLLASSSLLGESGESYRQLLDPDPLKLSLFLPLMLLLPLLILISTTMLVLASLVSSHTNWRRPVVVNFPHFCDCHSENNRKKRKGIYCFTLGFYIKAESNFLPRFRSTPTTTTTSTWRKLRLKEEDEIIGQQPRHGLPYHLHQYCNYNCHQHSSLCTSYNNKHRRESFFVKVKASIASESLTSLRLHNATFTSYRCIEPISLSVLNDPGDGVSSLIATSQANNVPKKREFTTFSIINTTFHQVTRPLSLSQSSQLTSSSSSSSPKIPLEIEKAATFTVLILVLMIRVRDVEVGRFSETQNFQMLGLLTKELLDKLIRKSNRLSTSISKSESRHIPKPDQYPMQSQLQSNNSNSQEKVCSMLMLEEGKGRREVCVSCERRLSFFHDCNCRDVNYHFHLDFDNNRTHFFHSYTHSYNTVRIVSKDNNSLRLLRSRVHHHLRKFRIKIRLKKYVTKLYFGRNDDFEECARIRIQSVYNDFSVQIRVQLPLFSRERFRYYVTPMTSTRKGEFTASKTKQAKPNYRSSPKLIDLIFVSLFKILIHQSTFIKLKFSFSLLSRNHHLKWEKYVGTVRAKNEDNNYNRHNSNHYLQPHNLHHCLSCYSSRSRESKGRQCLLLLIFIVDRVVTSISKSNTNSFIIIIIINTRISSYGFQKGKSKSSQSTIEESPLLKVHLINSIVVLRSCQDGEKAVVFKHSVNFKRCHKSRDYYSYQKSSHCSLFILSKTGKSIDLFFLSPEKFPILTFERRKYSSKEAVLFFSIYNSLVHPCFGSNRTLFSSKNDNYNRCCFNHINMRPFLCPCLAGNCLRSWCLCHHIVLTTIRTNSIIIPRTIVILTVVVNVLKIIVGIIILILLLFSQKKKGNSENDNDGIVRNNSCLLLSIHHPDPYSTFTFSYFPFLSARRRWSKITIIRTNKNYYELWRLKLRRRSSSLLKIFRVNKIVSILKTNECLHNFLLHQKNKFYVQLVLSKTFNSKRKTLFFGYKDDS